jgi:hypothetical protein
MLLNNFFGHYDIAHRHLRANFFYSVCTGSSKFPGPSRRILLARNRDFNDHHDASYELMLTKEFEKAERDREERERMKRQKQEEKLLELVHCNASAFIPYGKIGDFDVEDEDENLDEIDETQPQVISEQGIGDLASTDNADSVRL